MSNAGKRQHFRGHRWTEHHAIENWTYLAGDGGIRCHFSTRRGPILMQFKIFSMLGYGESWPQRLFQNSFCSSFRVYSCSSFCARGAIVWVETVPSEVYFRMDIFRAWSIDSMFQNSIYFRFGSLSRIRFAEFITHRLSFENRDNQDFRREVSGSVDVGGSGSMLFEKWLVPLYLLKRRGLKLRPRYPWAQHCPLRTWASQQAESPGITSLRVFAIFMAHLVYNRDGFRDIIVFWSN